MKPPMQEELEDDLAAEEENKLINEVRRPASYEFRWGEDHGHHNDKGV